MEICEIIQQKIIIQRKGVSAIHPIILLERKDDFVVCSAASWEGDSNFDYSIIIKKDGISLDLSDEELITKICKTQNYLDSSWGFSLALANGLNQEELNLLFPLIDIQNDARIRLSRATRKKRE